MRSISTVKVVSHVGAIMAWMSVLLPAGAAEVLELREGDVVAFLVGVGGEACALSSFVSRRDAD